MIFVTGATGFIGQRLIVRLRAQGRRLKILSRSRHSEFETVVCDQQNEDIPSVALEGVDTVFHLAGYAHDLGDASELEGLYRKVNVDATARLAELAVSAEVKRFIFVSSVKAGDGSDGASEGIYGETKCEAELKVLGIGRQSGMHVSIVRPSLVYGPGVKGNLALMQAGAKKGWFPPLPETGNRRSMIHVDDLVRALVFVAENEHANGQIYIATDGVPHSSREIYEAVCRSVGRTPRNWSVPKWVFNIAAVMNSKVRFKLDKLLGDDCYSSSKLESLGFKAEKGLMDFSQSDFDMGVDELQFSHERLHSS